MSLPNSINKESILHALKQTRSEDEWNLICREVKVYTKTLPEAEKSGDYPSWWFGAVIQTGLAASQQMNW